MSTKLFTSKKEKTKKKDKELAKQQQTVDVSGPIAVNPGEGLYKKLALHQTNIMHQLEIITNSLDKIPGEDDLKKEPNYSTIITQLLQQLDCAVSTTQQCLTKDIFETNTGLKRYVHEMYANIALLVKWADFASRDPRYSMNREYIFFCVTRFKDALNNVVRFVAESVIPSSSQSLNVPNRLRRSSVNDALLNRIENGSATLPMPENNHVSSLSTPGVPTRAKSLKPRLNVSRDSLNSDSSDSDVTNNRRSDSIERHEDARYTTPPPFNNTPENGFNPAVPRRKHSSPGQDQTFHLPVINGEMNGQNEKPPPIPIKKRKQLAQMRSSISPHTSPTHVFHQHSASMPITELTPPIPMRASYSRKSSYDDVPPPLPVKKGSRSVSLAGTPHVAHSLPPTSRHLNAPLPPLRVDSIGLRTMLEGATGTPPPSKPPRTDNFGGMDSGFPPPSTFAQPNLLQLLDKYNKTIQRADTSNGEAPPIPPKKRTVLLYNQLIQMKDYTFDDSHIPSLNLPAPPPLPPKKRRRKPEQPTGTSSQIVNGSPRHSLYKSSTTGSQDELSSDELDEKVNYLEVDEVSPYLKFDQDDGSFTLNGGPIDALIAYAGSTNVSVKQYTEAFLSTYYTFITPDELITKLLYRLHHFYKEGNQQVWQATTSLLVRVLTNLHAPLIKEAEIALIELIHTMLKEGNLKFGQLVRNALVEKLNQKMPEFIPLSIAMCKNSGPVASITDFDPSDVAKQLTILDADYFYKVDVSEMLYWAKEHNEEKCPQLTLFTMHFNNVSQWIKSRLLEKDLDWKKRERLMLYFVSVMKALREYNNFNAYLALLSAIESAPVSRLDWSERILKGLEEPRALIDSRGSFKNYRQAFAQTKPPCIPYIGLYLQDLTFLEEQPSKLEDGVSINFGKRWKQFKSVDHIRFAQTKQYSGDQFQPDPNIMGVFHNFDNVETDEKLWERSTDIKPSNRQKSIVQTVT